MKATLPGGGRDGPHRNHTDNHSLKAYLRRVAAYHRVAYIRVPDGLIERYYHVWAHL